MVRIGRFERPDAGSIPAPAFENVFCLRRAAWSARHFVAVEIVGSNPTGDVFR